MQLSDAIFVYNQDNELIYTNKSGKQVAALGEQELSRQIAHRLRLEKGVEAQIMLQDQSFVISCQALTQSHQTLKQVTIKPANTDAAMFAQYEMMD